MKLKAFGWARGTAAAMVILLGACNGNQGGGTPVGGSGGAGQGGGKGGQSGQSGETSAGGGSSGSGGAQGGQTSATGGSARGTGGGGQGGQTAGAGGGSGGSTGKGGQGGQATGTGGSNPGGAGGASGQGGTDARTDAAAGASGAGGTGGQGGTSRSPADAADASVGGMGGTDAGDGGGAAGRDAGDAAAVGNPGRVILCDEGNRRVLLVDLQSGKALWSTLLNDSAKYGDSLRDIQLVGGGRVAASTAKGYVELDLATGAIKKEVSKLSGVESMRRLANGNTIFGGNSDGGVTLQELDAQDAAVTGHKVTFTSYSDLRMLRRTPQGTFLIGVGAKLAEVNWSKQTVWEMTIPDGNYVYQGLRLPNNTIAVTSGYGAAILVIDPAAKQVLTTLGGKSQPDATTIVPNFYAGYQILPSGHYVVTNWQGHGGGNGGKGIQLLEYDASGSLVWRWKQDPSLVSSLHNVIVLDGLDTSKLHDDVNGVLAPVTQ